MTVYKLYKKQFVPINMDQAWDFFSTPKNLKKLTPSKLNFVILESDLQQKMDTKMYPGMIIRYKVSPILNIPLFWMTEITQVEHRSYFIDEQRVGPYAIWHHEHHFTEVEGGVMMEDLLYYKLPFGPLGSFLNKLFVRKQIEEIFNYRAEQMTILFPPSRP